jgi:hypothetical protein
LGWDVVAKVGKEGGGWTASAINDDGVVEGAWPETGKLGFERVEFKAIGA